MFFKKAKQFLFPNKNYKNVIIFNIGTEVTL